MALISFYMLCKNCYTMDTCNLIALIFGTNEECVMMDSHAKSFLNLRYIQGVMSIYYLQKDKTSVTATG